MRVSPTSRVLEVILPQLTPHVILVVGSEPPLSERRPPMPKLGLALSGGGFRATLFHLGVVRFLRDAGALPDVTDVASVSGGSILAAHLVLNWDQYNGDEQRFAEAAAQIVKFVRFDVRNHIVRRLPLLYGLGLVSK